MARRTVRPGAPGTRDPWFPSFLGCCTPILIMLTARTLAGPKRLLCAGLWCGFLELQETILCELLRDLGFPPTAATPLHCDNDAARLLAGDHSHHANVKHIRVKYHSIRDMRLRTPRPNSPASAPRTTLRTFSLSHSQRLTLSVYAWLLAFDYLNLPQCEEERASGKGSQYTQMSRFRRSTVSS